MDRAHSVLDLLAKLSIIVRNVGATLLRMFCDRN